MSHNTIFFGLKNGPCPFYCVMTNVLLGLHNSPIQTYDILVFSMLQRIVNSYQKFQCPSYDMKGCMSFISGNYYRMSSKFFVFRSTKNHYNNLLWPSGRNYESKKTIDFGEIILYCLVSYIKSDIKTIISYLINYFVEKYINKPE